MQKMGVPSEFNGLLKSCADQFRIIICIGGAAQEPPLRQEKGVPQGDDLSPIIFNPGLVMETLLRDVNAHAAELGVTISAEAAESVRVQTGKWQFLQNGMFDPHYQGSYGHRYLMKLNLLMLTLE